MKRYFKKIFIVMIMAFILLSLKDYIRDILQGKYKNEVNNIFSDLSKSTQSFNGNTELLLVNNNNGINKNYIPEGLSIPNIEFTDDVTKEEKHIASIVKEPLENLIDSAKNQGIILLGNSAYRSYKSQKIIYDNRVKSQGKELADLYVAKPGYSEHQTGLCIDITNKDNYLVKGTIESDWLEENCYKFGFIIRYPEGKQDITGIEYEPWHIRYVGIDAANYIYNNGITLEEYLGQ